MKILFEITFQDNRKIMVATGIASDGENSIRIWYQSNGTMYNESYLLDDIFSIEPLNITKKILSEYNFSFAEKNLKLSKANYDEWIKTTNLLFQKTGLDKDGNYCEVFTKEEWLDEDDGYLCMTPEDYFREELSYS